MREQAGSGNARCAGTLVQGLTLARQHHGAEHKPRLAHLHEGQQVHTLRQSRVAGWRGVRAQGQAPPLSQSPQWPKTLSLPPRAFHALTSFSASSSSVWIHPLSRLIVRSERMWRSMPATMPGTPATVSK